MAMTFSCEVGALAQLRVQADGGRGRICTTIRA
jgi:hypothetical protein